MPVDFARLLPSCPFVPFITLRPQHSRLFLARTRTCSFSYCLHDVSKCYSCQSRNEDPVGPVLANRCSPQSVSGDIREPFDQHGQHDSRFMLSGFHRYCACGRAWSLRVFGAKLTRACHSRSLSMAVIERILALDASFRGLGRSRWLVSRELPLDVRCLDRCLELPRLRGL